MGGSFMRERAVTTREIMLIAGTRGALGVGLRLLIAARLNSDTRKVVGWTLFAIGALSTVPLLVDIFSKPVLGDQN
jgi:hypothetical protein